MIFRYPGGKSKLSALIDHYLCPMLEEDNRFYDVFTGGGSIALAVAKKYPDAEITMNDLDRNIFSFWYVVASQNDYIKELLKLMRTKPTIKLFSELRSREPKGLVEQAYYAIFFNRCAFSGIYMSGPIGGVDQKSEWTVGCRYNYKRLKKEMLDARKLLLGRTTVTDLHFKDVLKNDGVFYCDPPYYTVGDSLYPVKMMHEEHIQLASILKHKSKWVLSYDICPEIKELYKWAKIVPVSASYCISGTKKGWKKSKECIITRNT
jgi:DNA adenine methylase